MRKDKLEPLRRRSLSDPLAVALLPPPNETPLERESRLHAELRAKQVSDGIDEMIRKERFEKKKTKAAEVKVLLLGQSESGKSTTLKRESWSPLDICLSSTWMSKVATLLALAGNWGTPV